MTIGIAAAGPGAGRAILRALETVERVGQGALGGFVSLAAINDGTVERAEVQRGGSKKLFPDDQPPWLATSRCAVLMSSGPDRPAPLSQFTPGSAASGLVTGHRFPNTPDRNGRPLNLATLDLLQLGLHPQAAVDRVAEDNVTADAGLIAVTPDGRIGVRDFAYLAQFADRGQAVLSSDGRSVAVAHNAIAPYRGLALVAAEVALDALDVQHKSDRLIEFRTGVPVLGGPQNAVQVDARGTVVGLVVANAALLSGAHSFGLGYQVRVVGLEQEYRLAYEPYLMSKDGRLESVDGATRRLVVAR